jgi:hypothetical protein
MMHSTFRQDYWEGEGESIQIELQLEHAFGENVIKGKHTMATQ